MYRELGVFEFGKRVKLNGIDISKEEQKFKFHSHKILTIATDSPLYEPIFHDIRQCANGSEEEIYTVLADSRIYKMIMEHDSLFLSINCIKAAKDMLDAFGLPAKINKADEYFSQALKEIIETGIDTSQFPMSNVRTKWLDGTMAHYIYITNKVFEYDLSNGEFPLISLRPQAWKSAIKEILWIYQDQSNDLKLLADKHNIHWWNEWESKMKPGTIGQ